MSRDPETPEQWQDAVDAANACLAPDSARQYGLVEGGPKIDVDRCDEILRRGALLGYRPSPDAVERSIAETNAEAGERAAAPDRLDSRGPEGR